MTSMDLSFGIFIIRESRAELARDAKNNKGFYRYTGLKIKIEKIDK